MERLLQNWDQILAGLQSAMPGDCLRDMFYQQVEKSSVLKEDIAHYRREARKGPSTPDYCLTYLRHSVERYVEQMRHERNLQDRKIAYQSNQPQLVDSSAAPGAEIGKANGQNPYGQR